MVARILLTLLVITISPLLALGNSGPIREGSLSASSDGSRILVRWLSSDESGVMRYELERKAGADGQFFLLVQLNPKGNNALYEYVDDTAFRVTQSIYKYQVKVLFSNGSPPIYVGPITVTHNPSSVRRTWGSIKAMFR